MKNLLTFIFAVIFAAGLVPSVSFADAPLSVSCTPSIQYADYGEVVTWNAVVANGTAPYTYAWSGADGYEAIDALSGSSDTTTKTYSTAGGKSGHIIVTDGLAESAQADCSEMVALAPLSFDSCSANEVNGMVGQTITWTSNISGGLPPYTFSLTGTDGLSGSGTQTTIVYSATGTKTAQIGTITDSLAPKTGHTLEGTHNCSVPLTIHPIPTIMTASCSASPSTLSTGSSVTWTATVSGGNSPYTVNWSGDDSLSGTGSSITKVYSSSGTKSAQIANVTSADGQTLVNISCGNVTVNSPGGPDGPGGPAVYTLVASCSANPASVTVGSSVLWSAIISGGTTPYSYVWTGSDNLSVTTSSVSKTYSTVGTATSSIRVTSFDNQVAVANCSAGIVALGTSTTTSTSTTSTATTTSTTGNNGTTTGTSTIGNTSNGTGNVGNGGTSTIHIFGPVNTGNGVSGSTTTASSTATTTSTSTTRLVASAIAGFAGSPYGISTIGFGLLLILTLLWKRFGETPAQV
ncbi:MAG: hypothetical protein WCW14_02975 [Candidatus Paceibacterota bacterium]